MPGNSRAIYQNDRKCDMLDARMLAKIARMLLRHGADPKPAMELAECRYGKYSKDDAKWEAWSVVAEAAAAAERSMLPP